MSKALPITTNAAEQSFSLIKQTAIVICASAVIAVCARLMVPLPFTPVPLTLANFGVLLVGLTLGSKRGFAAAALYLAWGAMGLPVFASAGPGSFLQMLGPTGGYLWAYPVVAFLAGWVAEHGARVSPGIWLAPSLPSLCCSLPALAGWWFTRTAGGRQLSSGSIRSCLLKYRR